MRRLNESRPADGIRYLDAVVDESTERALLRAATTADAAGIAEIYRPYVLESAISFEEVPPEPHQIEQRMLAAPRLPWLVATRSQKLVGYSYASRHRDRAAYRWSVDVSVYLDAHE